MKNLGSVLAAYIAVWVIFFGYYLTVGLRLSRLAGEIKRLKNSQSEN